MQFGISIGWICQNILLHLSAYLIHRIGKLWLTGIKFPLSISKIELGTPCMYLGYLHFFWCKVQDLQSQRIIKTHARARARVCVCVWGGHSVQNWLSRQVHQHRKVIPRWYVSFCDWRWLDVLLVHRFMWYRAGLCPRTIVILDIFAMLLHVAYNLQP